MPISNFDPKIVAVSPELVPDPEVPNGMSSVRELADHLIISLEEDSPAGEKVNFGFEIIKSQLTSLVGTGGFSMIMSNALSHSKSEVAWLRDVDSKSNGSIIGLEAACANISHAEFRAGSVVVLANIIGLLVGFIGPIMTEAVIRDTWPNAPVMNLVRKRPINRLKNKSE